MEYLLECFKTAREELLHRVKHRDNYLKLHLLVQGILFCLYKNIKIAGVETASPLHFSLYLSVPLTFIFALLYYTEDRLIGHLGSYIGQLSNVAKKNETQDEIYNWDASPQLLEYSKTTLVYRFLAHLSAFVIIPGILLNFYYDCTISWNKVELTGFIAQITILFFLAGLSIKEYIFRKRNTAKKWKNRTKRLS